MHRMFDTTCRWLCKSLSGKSPMPQPGSGTAERHWRVCPRVLLRRLVPEQEQRSAWAWAPHWEFLPGCWRACRVAFRVCPTADAGASGAGERCSRPPCCMTAARRRSSGSSAQNSAPINPRRRTVSSGGSQWGQRGCMGTLLQEKYWSHQEDTCLHPQSASALTPNMDR
jgi:hypothetical protein